MITFTKSKLVVTSGKFPAPWGARFDISVDHKGLEIPSLLKEQFCRFLRRILETSNKWAPEHWNKTRNKAYFNAKCKTTQKRTLRKKRSIWNKTIFQKLSWGFAASSFCQITCKTWRVVRRDTRIWCQRLSPSAAQKECTDSWRP